MKTFLDLIEEVQNKGLCHHCGGCVTFCTAVNYAALKINDNGMPEFEDKTKCIECGLCYSICPEIEELEEETQELFNWVPPIGRVIETNIARARDSIIRDRATDGGVVTGLLVHLLERGHIDGAIVTKQTGPFTRQPTLATTRDEIIESAGFYFDSSHGMKHFSGEYSTYSPSVQEFRPMQQKGLRRVAIVGAPCQIKAVRRMETLGIVPSDTIKYCLGLFCSGNFVFNEEERKKIEELAGFKWQDLKRINIKDDLMIHLKDGSIKKLALSHLDFMKRFACKYCTDYSAEYSDLSFGGIGAQVGYTSIITRTSAGRAIFADAVDTTLELFDYKNNPDCTKNALQKILKSSEKKLNIARDNRSNLIKENK